MKGFLTILWLLPALAVAQLGTGVETPDGSCGVDAGFTCTPTWGSCCGKDNLCGRSTAYCGTGCQPLFGNCNVPVPSATPVPTGPGSTSPDGSCGGTNQYNCTGSTFGSCCSSSNYCGSTSGHCEAGCQPAFGTCTAGTSDISTDGSCGANGKTCTGSSFGACCSSNGYCGDTTGHCSAGCQSGFGNCTDAGNVSTDGSCSTNGKTCLDSSFGDCCSASNYCGSTSAFCDAGCQAGFGNCTVTSSNISTDGACGKNGKTCKGSTFGDCCSSSGFCGTGTDFCGAGCQAASGTCTAADNVSTDGSCGKNGKTCKGSTFGDCCSSSGFCGTGSDFCGAGCQAASGTCSAADNISTDGSCGKNGKTCKGSSFGDCCSSSGFCGTGDAFCGSGCQTASGTCNAPTNISTDGACGKNGKTCKGSTFGNCCSSSGFCGSTDAFCGTGCQAASGTCGTSAISTDGECGKNGKTCQGSSFGNCCSSAGYCGKTDAFCTQGCQASFGTCSAGAGSITTNGECGTKNGKTCVGSTFGTCCSAQGFCGNTAAGHCGVGCQKGSSSACLTTNIPSVDGTCGTTKGGLTCAGGDFNGYCCSSSGYCGTSSAFCGSGCQKGYGKCT